MKARRAFLAVLLCLWSVCLLFGTDFRDLTAKAGRDDRLTFYFIDLDVPDDSPDKSGDATLVVSPEGKTLLIDCGHPDAGKDVLRVLDALGIDHLDYFVNSHPHIDHLGAFPQIADKVGIGQVYRTGLSYDTQYTRAFAAAIEDKRIPCTILSDGDGFDLDGQVHVEVLAPEEKEFVYPAGYPANSTAFVNDSSLSLKLTYGDSVALFCGDLYRGGERRLLDAHGPELKADLAKANHHGGDTSNQLKWIKAVLPEVVVAMNDRMGSMAVYQSYVKHGATFYHTFYNGLVKVEMDQRHGLSVDTEKTSWVEEGGGR